MRLLLSLLVLLVSTSALAQSPGTRTIQPNDRELSDDRTVAAKFRLSDQLMRSGQAERAIALLEDLQADDPVSQPIYLKLKYAYVQTKQYDDAIALARRGWQVTALDVVPSLAAEMGAELERLGGEYVVGDALRLEGEPFDLVWDHTFFCAIDPGSRAPWGQRVRDLVVPGGRYTALVFPVGKPA
ncbi:MAG: tetratricopeptide repeat protein, partial [Bacteroidota bacterium]